MGRSEKLTLTIQQQDLLLDALISAKYYKNSTKVPKFKLTLTKSHTEESLEKILTKLITDRSKQKEIEFEFYP